MKKLLFYFAVVMACQFPSCMAAIGGGRLIEFVASAFVNSDSSYIIGMICGYTFWAIGTTTSLFLAHKLIAAQDKRGEYVCLTCGYSLKGLSEPRCPECGKPFEP